MNRRSRAGKFPKHLDKLPTLELVAHPIREDLRNPEPGHRSVNKQLALIEVDASPARSRKLPLANLRAPRPGRAWLDQFGAGKAALATYADAAAGAELLFKCTAALDRQRQLTR